MINPDLINTIRTGQLPTAAFSLTDKIPHEIGVDLKSGTVQSLADIISAYIGASDGVGFRAVTITDGQTLPTTTNQEFILVGKGTYYNVSGGTTLVLTEELNAVVSNGSFWFVGVEVPIDVQLSVSQEIRSGFTTMSPSEDAVFKALALKADISNGDFTITDAVVTVAGTQALNIPNGQKAITVFINGALQYKTTVNNGSLVNRWSQTGDVITLTKTTAVNNYIYIISK